ncbi:glycosyltransferase family 25 protein [Agarivorans sp. MS3-6]|uniref:glycosyltransferase family 25 protein n=1 Tax=Agarivorans sp. TSD2052 TaxID=2937286 RepID=UPI00200C7B51|nr:glycosyltransferase family 25 protein [Agarivorans sp. TSD2052]UPW18544.1 glycosyltransferase family 25 protein [Agarivorans sp. TSD2052]
MKILVISLERSAQRRERITQEFSKLGLEFEFFDAVDGAKGYHPLFDKYDEKRAKWQGGSGLNAGELGCFASHFLIWQRCIELNEPVLVFEDDVLIPDDFSQIFSLLDDVLPRYQYIKLGRGRLRSLWPVGEFVEEQPLGRLKIVKYMRQTDCAHAYALTPDAAKRFVDNASRWIFPVDDYMDKEHLSKVLQFGVEPRYVFQRGEDSDIKQTIDDNTQRKRISTIRRIRREYYRYRDKYACNWINYGYWFKRKLGLNK